MKYLRRLVPYIWAHRRAYLRGILILIAGSAIFSSIPRLLGKAIDAISMGGSTEFFGIGLSVNEIAAAVVLLSALYLVLAFRGRQTVLTCSRHVEYDLRNDLYRRLMRLPGRYFDRHSSGDIASRVINDIEGVRMVAAFAVRILFSTTVLFLFSMLWVSFIDIKLAALVLIPLLLISVITARIGPLVYKRSRASQERLADISDLAQENFSGARVVRAFHQEDQECAKFEERAEDYARANVALAKVRGLMWGSLMALGQTAVVLVLIFGGSRVIDWEISGRNPLVGMSIGDLVAFFFYLFMLIWPVIALGWVVMIFQRAAACMKRLLDILDAEPDEPEELPDVPPPQRGEIEMRNLTFQYEDDRAPALQDLSLHIRPGERVAIVGRTGSGKSTIVQILLGLYRVPDGHILIDGRDINEYPRRVLRSAIGSVPQDTFLWSDRLSENIAFGGNNGGTDEKVREAAEVSRILQDAEGFPDGLDQVIGERGVTLSGGQKQRAALARAVIRRPTILLLDDALSSVDAHTEHEILDHLAVFMKGRTCVFVTHRFSVLQHVERILVMDEGRIVEEGTHEELVRLDGSYKRLIERQRLAAALGRDNGDGRPK
ncbi:MAG: ABC transporter ATP-binding protein [Planctomycetota bacterium]|jgi:ATP-binding cassette subfamily B protein